MFKIPTTASELRTIDLVPGVTIQVAELRSRDMIEARGAARGIYAAGAKVEEGAGIDDTAITADATWVMALVLAKRLIKGWTGIGNEAGEPIDPTPEAIETAMAVPSFFDAFEDAVVIPALAQAAEGNGSSSEPAGTSRTRDETTARPATASA